MEITSKIFTLAPLTYQEMSALVPLKMLTEGNIKKEIRLAILFKEMEQDLERSRAISREPVEEVQDDGDTRGLTLRALKMLTEDSIKIRIRKIQERMSAIRFRLAIHDYAGELERVILVERLNELYRQAKGIDPDGVNRFEQYIDKKVSKMQRRDRK